MTETISIKEPKKKKNNSARKPKLYIMSKETVTTCPKFYNFGESMKGRMLQFHWSFGCPSNNLDSTKMRASYTLNHYSSILHYLQAATYWPEIETTKL